jgi:hypothetical protein
VRNHGKKALFRVQGKGICRLCGSPEARKLASEELVGRRGYRLVYVRGPALKIPNYSLYPSPHIALNLDVPAANIMIDDKHGSQAQTVENIADIHGFKESEGYVADIEGSLRNNLKTARDGHTVLIPQPSDSPSDTLNWSPTRKHVILFIISLAAFLPDYGSATGAVTLLPQAA